MASPSYSANGTLIIPMDAFQAWALTFLPLGATYTLEKVKDKATYLEVPYTAVTPNSPAGAGNGVNTLPAPTE